MSSSIKQRKFGSEVKNKAEESSKSENNKSFLAALLEGYEKNTNQTTKKFDKYVFLPGTISAFVFLILTFLTNSKSTTFNKLLAIFGFFLVIFREKIVENVKDDERKKLMGEYLFYHSILLFICIKLFSTAPPK